MKLLLIRYGQPKAEAISRKTTYDISTSGANRRLASATPRARCPILLSLSANHKKRKNTSAQGTREWKGMCYGRYLPRLVSARAQNGISCNDRREPRAQTTPRGDTRRPTSGSQSTSEGEDCDVSRGGVQGPGTSSFSLSRRHERERPTEGRKEEVVEGWYISFKSWFLTVSLQDLEGRDVPTGEARPSTNSPSAR